MSYTRINFERVNHVAWITLNRPEVRNALDWESYDELDNAFGACQTDPEIRCVLLTGADPSFCSGDDVKAIMAKLAETPDDQREHVVRHRTTPLSETLLDFDKPVVCAVNGAAVGWGMELTLYCDIRIASDRAKFGELFIQRGLIPDVAGLWRLPQLVGPATAAEILFTGDIIDSAKAERIGLVSRVVPHDRLLDAAGELAAKIATNPPLALRYIKEGLRRARFSTPQEIGTFCGLAWERLRDTEDHQERYKSFLEKRAPVFKGK